MPRCGRLGLPTYRIPIGDAGAWLARRRVAACVAGLRPPLSETCRADQARGEMDKRTGLLVRPFRRGCSQLPRRLAEELRSLQQPGALVAVGPLGRPSVDGVRHKPQLASGEVRRRHVADGAPGCITGGIGVAPSLPRRVLLNTRDATEAKFIMESLPLAKEDLLDHEYIPVGPLMPLRQLL
jgi:hypothetical protein